MALVYDPATGSYKAEPGERDPLLMPAPLAEREAISNARLMAPATGNPWPSRTEIAPPPNALDKWFQGEQAAAQQAQQGPPPKITPTDLGGWIRDPLMGAANVVGSVATGIADIGLLGADLLRWGTGNMAFGEVGNSADNPLTAWRIKNATPESEVFKAASYMGEIAAWFVAPGKAWELGSKVGLALKGAKAIEAAGDAKNVSSWVRGTVLADPAIGGLASSLGKIKEATAPSRFAVARAALQNTKLRHSTQAGNILKAFDEATPLMASQMQAALANSAKTNAFSRTVGFFTSNADAFIKAGPGQWAQTFGEVVVKDAFANFMVTGARPLEQDASGISRTLADASWAPPMLSAGARYLVPEYQDAALVAKAKMMAEGSILSAFIQPLMDAARIGLVAKKFKFDQMAPEMREQLLGLLNPQRVPDYVGQRMLQAADDVKGFLPPVEGSPGRPRTGYPGPDAPAPPSPLAALGPSLDDLKAAKDAQQSATDAAKAANRTAEQMQRWRQPEPGAPPAPRFPGEETLQQDRGYGKSYTQGEQAADVGRAPQPGWEGATGDQPPLPGGPEPGWTGGPARPGGPAPEPAWGSPPARPGEPAPAPAWKPIPAPEPVVSPEGIRNAAKADMARFMAANGNDEGLTAEKVTAFTEELGTKVMGLLPSSRAGRADYMKSLLPRVNRAGVMDPIDSIWHGAVVRQGLEEGWVRMADDFSSFQFSRAEAQALDESDNLAKLADSVHEGVQQERLLKAGAEPEVPAGEQTVDVQAASVSPADQSVIAQGQADIQAAGNQLQDTVQAGAERQPPPDMPTEVMGQEPAQPSIADQFQAVNDLNLAVDQRAQASTQARLDRIRGLVGEFAGEAPAADEAAVVRAFRDEVFEAAPAPIPPKLTDSFEISLPKISQNEKAMLAEAFGTGEGKVAFGAYSAKGGAQSMADVAEILEGMTKADGWTQQEIRTGASLSKKIRAALVKNADAINAVSEKEGTLKEVANAIDGLPNCDFTEML